MAVAVAVAGAAARVAQQRTGRVSLLGYEAMAGGAPGARGRAMQCLDAERFDCVWHRAGRYRRVRGKRRVRGQCECVGLAHVISRRTASSLLVMHATLQHICQPLLSLTSHHHGAGDIHRGFCAAQAGSQLRVA